MGRVPSKERAREGELLFLPLGVPAEGLLRDPGSRALVPTVCTGSEEEEDSRSVSWNFGETCCRDIT